MSTMKLSTRHLEGATVVDFGGRATDTDGALRDAMAGLLAQERAILAELSRAQRAELASLLRQLTAPFDNIPG